MPAYLKLESGKPVVARIKGYEGTREGQYGPQHVYDLIVNNDTMLYTTSSDKVHTELQANGIGNSVTIEKVFKNGKNYINVYPFAAPEGQRYVDDAPPPNPNDYPQAQGFVDNGVKLGRGSCFNNAFVYTLQHHPELSMGSGFLDKVVQYAGDIEKVQREYINRPI